MHQTPATTSATRQDPDAGLVQSARGGDYSAFEQLVTRHERSIYNLAMRIVQNRQDAEEIVQETFLSVVEHLVSFHGDSLFNTWLVRIATNHALKTLKRRKRRPTVPLEDATDDGPMPRPDFVAQWRDEPVLLAEQKETRAELREALESLEEKYRLVFLLRDVQELPTRETAEALGITEANVKVRLLRARLMLREKLTRQFGDEAKRVVPDHAHE